MRRSPRAGTVTLTNIKTVIDRTGGARRYLQVKGQKLIPARRRRRSARPGSAWPESMAPTTRRWPRSTPPTIRE